MGTETDGTEQLAFALAASVFVLLFGVAISWWSGDWGFMIIASIILGCAYISWAVLIGLVFLFEWLLRR